MDSSLALLIIVSLVHIFAAVMWIGGNFFELMTLVPALRKNSKTVQEEIATTVPVLENKNSAITATITIIAGPILAYQYSKGDMSVFLSTSGGNAILAGGLLAIVLYVFGWYAGLIRLKIARLTKITLAGVATKGSSEQISAIKGLIPPLNSRLTKLIYFENFLGAVVLGLMILAATL
ncbi:MAG: hypothetical protein OK439_06805 [Thaumarchaeota archaeon]|nr:hypothetical protein [Nitrososphaerota archaeon]